ELARGREVDFEFVVGRECRSGEARVALFEHAEEAGVVGMDAHGDAADADGGAEALGDGHTNRRAARWERRASRAAMRSNRLGRGLGANCRLLRMIRSTVPSISVSVTGGSGVGTASP